MDTEAETLAPSSSTTEEQLRVAVELVDLLVEQVAELSCDLERSRYLNQLDGDVAALIQYALPAMDSSESNLIRQTAYALNRSIVHTPLRDTILLREEPNIFAALDRANRDNHSSKRIANLMSKLPERKAIQWGVSCGVDIQRTVTYTRILPDGTELKSISLDRGTLGDWIRSHRCLPQLVRHA